MASIPTKSAFSLQISPSAIRFPQVFHSFSPSIVTAYSSRKMAFVRSAFASLPPPAASALRADTSGAASDGPVIWEERVEKGIYGCRFFTFLGVLGSLMGSVLCYLKGCVYVMNSIPEYFSNGGKGIFMLVEAIDVYLVGTVMLVFGMGLYELFISNLDFAKNSSHGSSFIGLFKLPERPKWLEIQTVRELKTKLGHVIVLVLLIGLFDKSNKVTIKSPIDLLCFAASVLFSSGCLYLLSMLQSSK